MTITRLEIDIGELQGMRNCTLPAGARSLTDSDNFDGPGAFDEQQKVGDGEGQSEARKGRRKMQEQDANGIGRVAEQAEIYLRGPGYLTINCFDSEE